MNRSSYMLCLTSPASPCLDMRTGPGRDISDRDDDHFADRVEKKTAAPHSSFPATNKSLHLKIPELSILSARAHRLSVYGRHQRLNIFHLHLQSPPNCTFHCLVTCVLLYGQMHFTV